MTQGHNSGYQEAGNVCLCCGLRGAFAIALLTPGFSLAIEKKAFSLPSGDLFIL